MKFDYNDAMTDYIEFKIWGARLLVDNFWKHDKSFLKGVSHSDDYYVAGIGKVKIQHVRGIDISFFPYQEINGDFKFVQDATGKRIEEKWNRGSMKDGNNYLWECVSVCPHGFCRLSISADGNVEYEFDDKDMIFEKEFFKNPFRYTYHI